jgi:V8-like Glu-specific endopeptidase
MRLRGGAAVSAALVLVLVVAGASAVLAGCASSGSPSGLKSPGLPGLGYWTRERLLGAQGWPGRHHQLPSPGATPTPRQGAVAPRVGALFAGNGSGDHFCTASVVDSPGHDVLITAAHCINSGSGGASQPNIAFIPDYDNGESPHGVWTPDRYVLAPGWVHGANPDLDVAFIVLKPLNGQNIQDVLGGNQIAFNAGYQHLVRVTGYPSSASAPIACLNTTSQQSQDQLKFVCNDFTDGTSGGPWITRFNPASRTGTIVGVIGGYQQGGDTPAVSYSAYLGSSIQELYREAVFSGG